ncbi:DUF1993 domain-containing protein [Noviherbaspirillum cavernae]|uniref:DUF1993 domain-containing protein n=1 Tax=Noviherbaspirillum cavernae TaxID=2320862 RepID=A0A418X1V1_9BURK|nr:DUF1993 domain-containing protein [Noviherbaspirillum cavernae]RJG06434.1 DUF1993 domain-containing protein [Noviherbaspirillum cavernae]
MSLSMYTASVPILVRMLDNLDGILDKAVAHAEANKIDPAVLINSRLYPDMLPLASQIRIASDTAKGCAARLADMKPPRYEDNEASFPELKERIRKTIDYLNTFRPEQIDGSEQRTITLQLRGNAVSMPGQQYLHNFVYANFYFHVATAYAILRHNGVELGKNDFLGAL